VQVPSPVGRAPLGGGDPGDGEPAFASQGSADYDGDDGGRDHYSRAQFDQKPRPEPRSGDASDQEGKAVVCVTNTSASS